MTDCEETVAWRKALDAVPSFLRGKWVGLDDRTLDLLLESVAYDFSLMHDDRKLKHATSISISPLWTATELTDAVMLYAYPLEPLDLSVSRLATAARYLGFTELSPYAAAVCYYRFKSLKEEYKCKKTK